MKTAIVNIGRIVSGEWRDPFLAGDSILMDDGRIVAAGTVRTVRRRQRAVSVDIRYTVRSGRSNIQPCTGSQAKTGTANTRTVANAPASAPRPLRGPRGDDAFADDPAPANVSGAAMRARRQSAAGYVG